MEEANSNYEEKFQRFSNIISTKTMQGFMVADRNDKALVSVLVKQVEKSKPFITLFNFMYNMWRMGICLGMVGFGKK